MSKFAGKGNVKNIPAVKMFTDREEPRKAFWAKFNETEDLILKEKISNKIQVISYYGYGGIGKSSLLLKLQEELQEKKPEIKYLFFDFEKFSELNNNILEILKVLRQNLKTKYNYSFPIFDLVVYVYETKLGKNVTKPELKNIFDENKELSFLKDFLSEIPIIGMFTKIIYLSESGKNILKERFNKDLKKKLMTLENSSIEEIKADLVSYFALDLKENILKENKPFVLFIDTYEKLVNEFDKGNALDNDLWLRGDNGLLVNLPNTLVVIAGREKLKWEELDKDWHNSLEQHLLGNLSFSDTSYFLKNASIKEEDLIHQLYDLTHGYPMYLDMCVDIYHSLIFKGKQPSIKDFGEDTTILIKRFLVYMDDNERDFATMLAFVPSWTDETIESIAKSMDINFSYSLYEKVKNFSFIVKENDTYKIQETIKDIIIANTPKALVKKYNHYKEVSTDLKITNILSQNNNINLEEEYSLDSYESKTAFKKVIGSLLYNITKSNKDDFSKKVQYLISKIDLYEEKFQEVINLKDFDNTYLDKLNDFKDQKEYYILGCYYTFSRSNNLKYIRILKENNYDYQSLIKRLIRYTYGYIDRDEYNELNALFKQNDDLYTIKFLSLTPKDHDSYHTNKELWQNKILDYTGEFDSFYLEILLESYELEDIKKKKVNKESPSDFSSEIFASFDEIAADVKSLNLDIAADADDYETLTKEEKFKIDKLNKIKFIIKTLKDNPQLLNNKILEYLLRFNSYNYGVEIQKLIFDYIDSIKYIALNSSDLSLIDAFYVIYKQYCGGEFNLSYANITDKDWQEKIFEALRKFRIKYYELLGSDAFVLSEISILEDKHKLITKPILFNDLLEPVAQKFGLNSLQVLNCYYLLTKEVKNIIADKKYTGKLLITLFDYLNKWGTDIVKNSPDNDFKYGYYEDLVEVSYKVMVDCYTLVADKDIKDLMRSRIVQYTSETLRLYDGKNKYTYAFDFALLNIKEYLKTNDKKLLSSIKHLGNLVIEKGYTDVRLDKFMTYFALFTILDYIIYLEDRYSSKTKFAYKFEFEHDDARGLASDYRYADVREKEKIGVLLAHLLLNKLLNQVPKLLNDSKEIITKIENGETLDLPEESPIYVCYNLIDLFYNMYSNQFVFTSSYHYYPFGFYLNIVATLINQLGFNLIGEIERKAKKFHFRKHDNSRFIYLNDLNKCLKRIIINSTDAGLTGYNVIDKIKAEGYIGIFH